MAGASPIQTQEDIIPPAPSAAGYRLTGVLLAPAVAATVHVILAGPVGLELQTPDGLGSQALGELSLLTTTLFALCVAIVSWIAVLALERGLGRERGRRIWMVVAFAVLAASFLPVALLDIPAGAAWGLVLLHSAVAMVLIPTMAARGQAPARPGAMPVAASTPH